MRSPTLLFAFVCSITAACDVGQVTVPAPSGGPDASAAAPDAAAASAPDTASGPACRAAVQTADTGHHNPGQNCGVTGCHGGGGGGPVWTASGTLYTSAAGTTPMVGATVTVIDANGVTIDLVTAQNGNFYTGNAIALPAKVFASQCPSLAQMISTVSAGSCNSCHVGGSATGAAHLP
jgi:hypothetical protein